MCLLSYLLDAEILDISTLAEDLDISAWLTPSLPECLMGFCKASLKFESADEILWRDHSNESSLPVLSHGAICLSGSERVKILCILELCSLFQALSEHGWCIGERHAKMYLSVICFSCSHLFPLSPRSEHREHARAGGIGHCMSTC